MLTRRRLLLSLSGLSVVGLVGCGRQSADSADLRPVAIQDGDECALCGMLITRFPGPKGEALVGSGPQVLKFCSTRDLFAWLTQPEARSRMKAAFVHDMAATDWEHPEDSTFVDATGAWYVVDQPLPGAMGPTLASFARQPAAQDFIQRHGGRLLAYADVDADTVARLSGGHDDMMGSEHR